MFGLAWFGFKVKKPNRTKTEPGPLLVLTYIPMVFERGGHLHLPFNAKVFILKSMIVRLPLTSNLSRQWKMDKGQVCRCFFCAISMEDNTHRFIKCPANHLIWNLECPYVWTSNKLYTMNFVSCYKVSNISTITFPTYDLCEA